jgi:phosphoribosyl 1,2-cyclic phosphodiesterase
MSAFTLEFHGVRGSLAAPGANTVRVGGNTSCVEVVAGDTRIVLDAGTGLRTIGERLVAQKSSHTTVLLSHVHWDHIQGLPFFPPIYVPGHRVEVISGPNGFMPLEQVMRRQMSPPCFPVDFDEISQRVSARDARPGEPIRVGDVSVRMARLNHPDPVYGYRLDYRGSSVVYATDTEHWSCIDPALRSLAAGADVLIYDAQYTPEEYPSKVGWGHSTFEAATALARAAGVGQLVLFHHDPRRDDEAVATIEGRARELFHQTSAAREGQRIDIASGAMQRVMPDAA